MSLQIIRYLTLDKCFSSKNRIYSIYELKEACEDAMFEYNPDLKRETISEKQIQNDIKFMCREDGGFDIGEVLEKKSYHELTDEKKRLVQDWHSQMDESRSFNPKKPNRKVYYYYNDPKFSIGRKPLTSSDAAKISEALLTLKRFKGLPQFGWIEEVSAKLNKFMDKNEVGASAISFDSSPFADGLKWIEPLYKAVIAQTPLVFDYHPFGRESKIHQVSPFLVKEFNKRWFVLCHTDQKDFLVNFALDRLKHISEGSQDFIKYPGKGTPDNFFDNIIGVIKEVGAETQEIKLLVENDHLPYLITKPLHKSQTISELQKSDLWTEITLKIKPNYEFYSLILSHGEKIKISSPEPVKAEFFKKLKKMYKLYK